MDNETLDGLINEKFKDLKRFFPEVEVRMTCVSAWLMQYYDAHEEYPPSNLLDRMATYILVRDTQKREGHTLPEELPAPYLSDSQLKYRQNKEAGSSFIEVSDSHRELIIPDTRDARRSWGMSK